MLNTCLLFCHNVDYLYFCTVIRHKTSKKLIMKQTVYSKKEVRNMLEFDEFNNVVVYRIINRDSGQLYSPFVFYSKSLALDWVDSFIKCHKLDPSLLYVSPTELRFY